jgi:hypothetical protein
MSSKIDMIREWHEAAYANVPSSMIEANEKYLSDDFQNLDQDGNVLMDKKAYIGLARLLVGAFKDYRAVISSLREDGDGVIMTFHFEGTHTGDLDLSAMGLGVIPASGKKIIWPEVSSKFVVEGDKITSIQAISGGMEWFLAPLGVTLPSA